VTSGGKERSVTGWLLPESDRMRLLERFPPAYPDVVAHHVTLTSGTDQTTPLPRETRGEVIGFADDGMGVQAAVVRIAGTSDRPDGSTYHITWSLDRSKGREAKDSNDVIARLGWKNISPPIPIALTPARFPAT
jgi:hypothetical protein